jgi:hypothetical protein
MMQGKGKRMQCDAECYEGSASSFIANRHDDRVGCESPGSREPHLRQFLHTINARDSARDEITDTGRNNDFPACGHV